MADDNADDRLAALVRRLEDADPDAHDEAFRRFHAPLVRYARGITGTGASARDVVQDVFLKLWEQRRALRVRVSLKAMLYTMVRNRALNTNRRSEKQAPDLNVAEARRQQNRHAAPPDRQLEGDALRAHLHRWIAELPRRRAEAFTLSRYHHLSHQEIAEAMDISKRTVDTHVYHALRDLRKKLDALHDEPRPSEN